MISAAVTLSSCATTGSSDSVFEHLVGTWDVADRRGRCGANPHTISFTSDNGFMILSYRYPVDGQLGHVLAARYEVLAYANHTVRVRLVDPAETRTDSDGNFVTWDLGLVHPTKYVWQRTDWKKGAFTDERIRC